MIRLYGILCAVSLALCLLGIFLCMRRKGADASFLLPRLLLLPPVILLCSRFVFVAANCTYYLSTLTSFAPALRFWEGGYSMAGALLGLFLSALFFRPMGREYLDASALSLLPALVLARAAESVTSMGCGRPTEDGLWILVARLQGLSDVRVPVWLLEALTACVLFVVVILLLRKRPYSPGTLFLRLMALFSATQILLESFRDDGHMVVHFVRIQQVLFFLLLSGIFLYASWDGDRKHRLLSCLLLLPVLGVGILAEFGVDRWGQPVLAYLLLGADLLFLLILTLRRIEHGKDGFHGKRENPADQ